MNAELLTLTDIARAPCLSIDRLTATAIAAYVPGTNTLWSDRAQQQADDFEWLLRDNGRLESQIATLTQALEAAAQVIRDWDEGDPTTESGWKHDELCDTWIAARTAVEQVKEKL